MECVDGVCKFVPKSQRGGGHKGVGENDENVAPALPLVAVGDKLPMPLPLEQLEEGGKATTLQSLCSERGDRGRVVVLDLWSNACVRCPEALDKLNALAERMKEDVEKGLVIFASVNIDDKAKARGLIAERKWTSLSHLFVDAATKEMLKARFGLTSVPFVMVFDQEGTLSQMGNPKKIDFDALPAMWKAKRQVGNEAKKEGGIDRQKKEDVAKEEMPVKALQAFTLDEDF